MRFKPSLPPVRLLGADSWLSSLLALAFLAIAAACGGGGGGSPVVVNPPPPAYVRYAALSGAQEVPANASVATGSAVFSYDPATKVLTGTVTTTGIVATAAHIHEGAPGVAGPVAIALTGGAGGVWTVPASTTLTDAQYATLQANGFYVNVHSAALPAGEIRGQIELRISFASLTGAQETPGSGSTATGYASLAVNPTTGAVSGTVVTTGIVGTNAHIHEAAAGTAGPVILPLTDAGGGVWTVPAGSTLTAAQVTSWLNGNLYVNVHTAAFPGGEIRGQLNLNVPVIQTTILNGSKEVPANASTATGTASVGLQPFTLEVTGGVATTGLTGTASHIHEGAAGVSGAVAFGLTDGGTGTWLLPAATRLTPSQFDAWRSGNLYVNVHSVAFPGGEIRGQLAAGGTGGGGGGTGGGGGY